MRGHHPSAPRFYQELGWRRARWKGDPTCEKRNLPASLHGASPHKPRARREAYPLPTFPPIPLSLLCTLRLPPGSHGSSVVLAKSPSSVVNCSNHPGSCPQPVPTPYYPTCPRPTQSFQCTFSKATAPSPLTHGRCFFLGMFIASVKVLPCRGAIMMKI